MKRYSTIFLRIAIFAAGAVVIALGFFAAWLAVKTDSSKYIIWSRVFLGGVCAAAVPFFIALYQSFNLLRYIDTNRTFSEVSVKALTVITRSALAEFIICTLAGVPFAYIIADMTDAPGIMLIGAAISGVAFVIFVFASVLARVLRDALVLKSENDLTI